VREECQKTCGCLLGGSSERSDSPQYQVTDAPYPGITSSYEGKDLSHGSINGKGILKYLYKGSTKKYIGEIRNNERHGFGASLGARDSYYIGDFDRNLFHG